MEKIVRIDIRLTASEVKKLDELAKSENRSRKNFCETRMREVIDRLRGLHK